MQLNLKSKHLLSKSKHLLCMKNLSLHFGSDVWIFEQPFLFQINQRRFSTSLQKKQIKVIMHSWPSPLPSRRQFQNMRPLSLSVRPCLHGNKSEKPCHHGNKQTKVLCFQKLVELFCGRFPPSPRGNVWVALREVPTVSARKCWRNVWVVLRKVPTVSARKCWRNVWCIKCPSCPPFGGKLNKTMPSKSTDAIPITHSAPTI